MSRAHLQRSARGRAPDLPPDAREDSPPEDDPDARSSNDDVHKCEVGDRYSVPKSYWDEGDTSGERLHGVVTKRVRGHSFIWFAKDDRETRYSGRLEDWNEYLVDANGLTDEEEREW